MTGRASRWEGPGGPSGAQGAQPSARCWSQAQERVNGRLHPQRRGPASAGHPAWVPHWTHSRWMLRRGGVWAWGHLSPSVLRGEGRRESREGGQGRGRERGACREQAGSLVCSAAPAAQDLGCTQWVPRGGRRWQGESEGVGGGGTGASGRRRGSRCREQRGDRVTSFSSYRLFRKVPRPGHRGMLSSIPGLCTLGSPPRAGAP